YKIAKIFNVSRPHIWKIRNNHRWNLAEKSFLMKDDISQMELGHQPVWWNDYVEKYIELKIQEMIELNK
ncbi:MAG: hypothetical protein OEZ01_16000, partial [Candidatus Heimdallarchaeota archaeon]|nr:hypothetical protein [Candidatus Heimdallarchaeota archaeon]